MHSVKHTERAEKFARTAAHLFAHQGYRGTSTREVARLAGVAENTLFRYFESKEKLFWAALSVSLAGWEVRPDLAEDLKANRSPEQVLPRLVAQVVDTTLLRPELVRLIAVAFLEMGSKAAEICRPPLAPLFDAVNRYLATQCEESGRKNLDPAMLTGAIVTTALFSGVLGELIDSSAPHRSRNRETIDAVSGFWTGVLAPAGRAG